jgi:hypothetical protein
MSERFDPAGGSFRGAHAAQAATGVTRRSPARNKRAIQFPLIATVDEWDALHFPAIAAS